MSAAQGQQRDDRPEPAAIGHQAAASVFASGQPGQKFPVASASEIPPGTHRIVEVEGRSIGVYNIRGSFHALRNICPHQGAELCKGLVTAEIQSSEPGDFRYEREGEIVRCPWHQWEFDIKTGCMIVDKRMRTKSYEVTVEKFDISVDDGYVTIHI